MLPDDFPAHLFPFDSHGVDVGGLRMHYVDEGHGQPVLMVHGNPTWSFYYRNLIAALSPTHRAIAADHVGMGFSDHPDRSHYPFSLERRVSDFGVFVNTVVPDGAVDLVVHDWGGAIGLGWAVENPDRVRRLVITNTAAFHPPDGRRVPSTLIAARSPGAGEMVVRGANAFVEGAIRLAVSVPLTAEEKRGYRAPYFSWKRRLGVYNFVRDIPVGERHQTFETIRLIGDRLDRLSNKPTLLAWGLKDFVFGPPYFDEFKRRFPDAETVTYENGNHLILDDERADLIPRVTAFLS